MNKDLMELRQAQLETKILELLQVAPMKVNAIRRRLNVSAALVRGALQRHRGICVTEMEDGRWVLLDEPADIPDELVCVGKNVVEDESFALRQRLRSEGIEPFAVGFSGRMNKFYWDDMVYPSVLKKDDWVIIKTNIYQVEAIEDLGVINHRRHKGHHYRIVTNRTRIVRANDKVLLRHYID